MIKNDISRKVKISFSGNNDQKRYQPEGQDIVFEKKLSKTISADLSRRLEKQLSGIICVPLYLKVKK